MNDRWSRGWVRWLAGFAFGALLGYSLFLAGIIVVLIAGLAVILAIVGRWQLAFVSGWLSGIGALWLGLMVRVVLSCSGDPTCEVGSGTQTWIGISLGFLLAGVAIGLIASRRIRRQGAP